MNEHTILLALGRHASSTPSKTALIYLPDDSATQISMTYAELQAESLRVARDLSQRYVAGSRLILSYPPGLDFVVAFLACLTAKMVAVPVYPPSRRQSTSLISAILKACLAEAVLTNRECGEALREVLADSGATVLETDALQSGAADSWTPPTLAAEDLAFIQFTSGSTRTPKGVCVSHGNLIANERAIALAFGHTKDSVVVGWLPMYHDMGLIGNLLQPLFLGAKCILMSPLDFLRVPQLWLTRISTYRATTSGGPNFAYELCLKRVPESLDASLDLSSWRVAYNGSEPVRSETLHHFVKRFSRCGFRAEAVYPCYGLAESTLFVTGGAPFGGARELSVDSSRLERNLAAPVPEGSPGARQLVSCGHIWAEQELIIVDPLRVEEVEDGAVGEIWTRGPSIAKGYWGDPAATQLSFDGTLKNGQTGYLRTGDLGFKQGGDLFMTGRLKDLIISRGRNLYPHDLEWTVETTNPAVRSGCSAALAVERDRREELWLVCEVATKDVASCAEAARSINSQLHQQHEVVPDSILFVRPRSIPKTSSGKIQRGLCRTMIREGSFPEVWRWQRGSARDDESAPSAASPAGDFVTSLMLGLWQEVLRVPTAAPTDDFFAVGGDSLLAMRFVERVEACFGVRINAEDLVGRSTFADMVQVVREHRAVTSRKGDVAAEVER